MGTASWRPVAERPAGPWRLTARRLRRDRLGLAAAVLLALVAMASAAAPLWAAHGARSGPLESHLTDRVRTGDGVVDVVALDGTPVGPTWRPAFLLGADESGRDLLVRLLYGGRTSLLIGAGAALLTTVLGCALGLLAGWAGGWRDTLVGRALDVVWSFPVLLAGVAFGTALTFQELRIGPLDGDEATKLLTAAVIGLLSVPYVARPVRDRVRALRRQAFVEAAEAAGAGPVRVALRELLPNLAPTLLALASVLVANAVVLESAFAFLGAGVRPPEPSWGSMLREGLDEVAVSPHLLAAPAAALTLTVLGVSLAGDALRRALDPDAPLPAAGASP